MDIERRIFRIKYNVYKNFYFVQTDPSAKLVTTRNNYISYYWNLKELTSSHDNTAILVNVENEGLKTQYNLRFSLTWLFSGIGIPLFLSSLFEMSKKEKFNKKTEFVKIITNLFKKRILIVFAVVGLVLIVLMFFIFEPVYESDYTLIVLTKGTFLNHKTYT